MVLKLIREIKKKPVCQLGKGTRLLVPRHQNSGAWTPELWCPYLIFVAVLSMHIYSCWQCLKKKKNCFCKHFAYAKPCYCAPISTWMNYLYGNCPNAIYWSKCWSTKGPPEPLSNRAGSSSLRRPPLQDTGGFWSYPLLQNFLCWGAIFLVPGHQMISASNPLICNKKSLEKPSYIRTLPA